MNDAPAAPRGLVDSLRALGDGLLASAQDRVALFALELQEEKLRVIQTLVWVAALIVTGVIALAMVSATLVYLFWDTARTTVLVALSGVHAALFLGTVAGFRRMLARQPRPLGASLEELTEDRRCLRGDN